MTRRTRWIMIVAAAAVVVGGVGGGVALAATGSENDRPITGDDLVRASAAALSYTGGGRVTDTEIDDEESYYEVEVTLPDGRQVDVRLDQNFVVVESTTDGEHDDESPDGQD